ncbi:hypothetical protein E1301_Tti023935 [Triplophysa tibetana]|uniref:Uncharacterized protein n=1 Tax=Triplophysa tibetana TaxID=1572043 RepID=A0A5A9PBF9_9TELE|nr:hypothetical protein E1301_Tti023935 [Triplophysa tibetana]
MGNTESSDSGVYTSCQSGSLDKSPQDLHPLGSVQDGSEQSSSASENVCKKIVALFGAHDPIIRFIFATILPPEPKDSWFPPHCPAGHGNKAAGSRVGIVYGRNYDGI